MKYGFFDGMAKLLIVRLIDFAMGYGSCEQKKGDAVTPNKFLLALYTHLQRGPKEKMLWALKAAGAQMALKAVCRKNCQSGPLFLSLRNSSRQDY